MDTHVHSPHSVKEGHVNWEWLKKTSTTFREVDEELSWAVAIVHGAIELAVVGVLYTINH